MFRRFERPSFDELRNILSYLPYSDREQWYKTFVIVGREYDRDPTAFEVCRQWSAQFPNRSQEDLQKEQLEFYQSSKSQGPTIGALIKQAKLNGYKPPRPQNDSVHVHGAPNSALDLFKVLSHTQPIKTPQNDALKGVYDDARHYAQAALKFWLYSPKLTDEKRASVMHRYSKAFDGLPEREAAYLRLLCDYCLERTEFTETAFVEWAECRYDNFDASEMVAYLTAADMAQTAEAAEDSIKRAIDASWRLTLQKRLDALSDLNTKFDTNFAEVESAFNQMTEDCRKFSADLPSNVGTEVSPIGRRITSEILSPDLSALHYEKTRYEAIDRYIHGWSRGEAHIVAAHSGVGKTWFGIDAADKVIEHGGNVLFISTEMDKDAITHRFFCNVSALNLNNLSVASPDEQSAILNRASREVTEFYKTDKSLTVVEAKTISSIVATINNYCSDGNINLVVIDYLQDIENDEITNKNAPNWERVRKAMVAIRSVAKRNHCPILVLAQLNNPNRKSGNNQEPNQYDIADSTHVVQDAAAVMVVYRQNMGVGTDGITELRMRIVKTRHGSIPEGHFKIERSNGSRFKFIDTTKV